MTKNELSQLYWLKRECKAFPERAAKLTPEIEAIEAWIDDIPDSMLRQAFAYRYKYRMRWDAIAARIGGGNTANGIMVACKRYLAKQK